MAAILKTPESRKWVVLGIKAAITALTLIPQLRERQRKPGCFDFKPPTLVSPYGLIFLDERGYVISSYRMRRHFNDDLLVDKEGIQQAATKAKAYGAVLTFDKSSQVDELSIAPDFVETVQATLADVDVRLFNQSFSAQ